MSPPPLTPVKTHWTLLDTRVTWFKVRHWKLGEVRPVDQGTRVGDEPPPESGTYRWTTQTFSG